MNNTTNTPADMDPPAPAFYVTEIKGGYWVAVRVGTPSGVELKTGNYTQAVYAVLNAAQRGDVYKVVPLTHAAYVAPVEFVG